MLESWQKGRVDEEFFTSFFSRRDLFILPLSKRNFVWAENGLWQERLASTIWFLENYMAWLMEEESPWHYLLAAIVKDMSGRCFSLRKRISKERGWLHHPFLHFRRELYAHISFFLHIPGLSLGARREGERYLQSMLRDMLLSGVASVSALPFPCWRVRRTQGVSAQGAPESAPEKASGKVSEKPPKTI